MADTDTINTQLTRIETAKANIKTAIEAKGVTVAADLTIDGYAAKVSAIDQGIHPSGTATEADVLKDKTFYVGDTQSKGTMPNNGATGTTITTQGGTYSIPAGYTSGGTVTASISNAAYTGALGATATISADSVQSVSAGILTISAVGTGEGNPIQTNGYATTDASVQIIADVSGNINLATVDSNFKASNIASTATIFGIHGTADVTGIHPSGNIAITQATSTDVTNYATATVSQCDASFYYNAQDMDEGRYGEDLNINPGGTYNITNSEFTTILGNNGGNACGIETSYNHYYLDFSNINQFNTSSWSGYVSILAMGTNVLEISSNIGTSSAAGTTRYINIPIGWNSKLTHVKVNPVTVNKYYTGSTTPASSLGANGDIYLKTA